MSSQQTHLRSVTPPGGNGGEASTGRQQPRQHAAKALPTDRMKMDRQPVVLGMIGRLSGPRKESVNADALSRAVGGVAPTTVILSNRFFADAGWITTPSKGLYAATDALVEYTRRLETGTPEYAAEALRGPARKAWFWGVLEPYIADERRLSLNEAQILLMRAAEASGGHLPMIRNLIAWLEYVGLIIVQDQHMAAAPGVAAPTDAAGAPAEQSAQDTSAATDVPGAGTGTESTKPTVRGGGEPPATVVAFSFDVKITTEDLARLTPEQIKALFEAVGAVMAAKLRD